MQGASRSIFPRSLVLFRSLCTEVAEEAPKKIRSKQKNLVEVGSCLPERGLGWKFTRNLWIRNGYEESYWTISKIVEKSKGRIRYYGRLTWKGKEDQRETNVKTWQKRGWRFIAELDGSKPRKTADGSTAPLDSTTVSNAESANTQTG